MNDVPRNWQYLPDAATDQEALYRNPMASYRFGRSTDGADSPTVDDSVWVEDPRAVHGRAGPLPADSLRTAAAPDRRVWSVVERNSDDAGPDDAAGVEGLDPLPEGQAIAIVRKHVLGEEAEIGGHVVGRLVAERVSVGWVVYPLVGGQVQDGETPTYYVADDGEFEQSSPAVDRIGYLAGFEQRFRLRRALFG